MIRDDMRKPTREGVLAAAATIAELLPPTPLLPVEIGGVRCHAKAETLQPVGAFKIRGGWWRLSNLTPEERQRGVVAVSSGNHAQGVAWAARRLGIKAAIVMPRNAPAVKLEATRALGAEIVLYDRPGEDREEVAAREVAEALVDLRPFPGQEDEVLAQIRELIGPEIEIEIVHHDVGLENPFEGDIVDRMVAALHRHDPGAPILPYLMSGGTDNKALAKLGIDGYGFAPLKLSPDLDFPAMFHGVDERVPLDALSFGHAVLRDFLLDC